MTWLIFIAVVILLRVLRPWIPSTILLDRFRTQRDPKWGCGSCLSGLPTSVPPTGAPSGSTTEARSGSTSSF